MPDSLAKQIRAEIEAKRNQGPPTPLSMASNLWGKVKGGVVSNTPEPIKGFLEAANKPIAGPFSGTDLMLGGPLLGALGAGAYKGLKALKAAPAVAETAVPGLTKATRAAKVMPPTQEATFRSLNLKPIITPEEAGQLRTLEPAVRQRASKVGLSYAAGGPLSAKPPAEPLQIPNFIGKPKSGGSRIAALSEANDATDQLEELMKLTGGSGARSVQGRGLMPAEPPVSSHGGPGQFNRKSYNMNYAGGDPQFAAKQAKARAFQSLKERAKGESGAMSTQLLTDLARGANQIRVGSMLSGAAIPKNILGSAGAVTSAALEGTGKSTLAPIREALRLPTNLKVAKAAWLTKSNPSAMSGAAGLNLPGRIIGAIDQTTLEALGRAGVPHREAQRLLLTAPNAAPKWLNSKTGRFLFPFQRTPFNVPREGISAANWNSPRKALTSVGAMGGGAVAGHKIDESRMTTGQKRLSLGLLAALSGPRALPVMMGAALGGAGREATAGISPMPEWALPASGTDWARTVTGMKPAITNLSETLAEKPTRGRSRRRRSGRPND